MALTFPLSIAAFQDKFTFASAEMFLHEPRKIDRTASGQVLAASLGSAIWRGSFQVPPTGSRAEAGERDALLSVLDRAGSSFMVYDPRKPYPASDPDGTGLGGTTPAIDSLAVNNREIALRGLPAGYVLTAGDLIGWQYGSSPTRYALHRLVTGAVASGTGVTPSFELTPFVQPGVLTGTAVTLYKPPIKAVLEPGPRYGAGRLVISEGPQFGFVQTMR